ncbi:hypothetical protein BGW80DRAFT_1286619 [Lactifluus volemus]|nr:hypothetical protein BGW80DRAFT_1286619 [Lactifluus volemus]
MTLHGIPTWDIGKMLKFCILHIALPLGSMSEYGQQGQTRENNSEQWQCQSMSRCVVSVALYTPVLPAQYHRFPSYLSLQNDLSSGESPTRSLVHYGRQGAIHICQQLEDCLEAGGEHILELLHNLRRFQAQLRREELQNVKQTTLEDLWGNSGK